MAHLQDIPGTAVAFTEFNSKDAASADGKLAMLEGGVLRAMRGKSDKHLELPHDQTHYGFLARGRLAIECMAVDIRIPEGFYFSIPGRASLELLQDAEGVIISKPDFDGFLTFGKIEVHGRLKYINGCTDSLLIPPIKMGDPCLNLLYFPPQTDQTMHTHPSDRIGMILSGRGECVTEDERGRVVTPLRPGMLFCIHTGGRHKFLTRQTPMRVLAYHPDSDFGPTDEDHPMINRTMVEGVSAAKLAELHTT